MGSHRSLTFAYFKLFLVPTRQQTFKKGRVNISESSTHGALFLEKVFGGLRSRMTFAAVNKI